MCVAVALADLETQAYWDLSYPSASVPSSPTLDSMISTVRNLLVDAVQLRLRSDVPLSVYLSGGIDSSAVAGIAAHLLREKDRDAKLKIFALETSPRAATWRLVEKWILRQPEAVKPFITEELYVRKKVLFDPLSLLGSSRFKSRISQANVER
ncbi:hypothetical protein B0H17DRAFT_1200858 [Mycena rosella]|uniref:Asparagine synthetase domain-containing protein n=1 Tax=Mycena rosella TaxID=1033263 RepID=A0AAD7DKK4_MYCRO|nr:hypothetical protein B0H17DRAFT_1200858 [Mycena rosella]